MPLKKYEDFVGWTIFWKVIKTGSLSEAAVALDLEPGYASRVLSRLEKAVGEPLLMRNKRPIIPTVRGAEYYDEVGPTIAEFQRFIARHFEDSTFQNSPYIKTIRTSAPQGLAHRYFQKLLGEYMSRVPGSSFCLYIEKAPREVLRNRLDVLVSLAQDAAPGLKRFPVRKTPCLMLASPAYLQEHGVPRVPQDLCTHTGLERIGDNFPSSGHILFRGEDRENFIFERNIFSESSISLIDSAVQGQGIIFDIPAELVVDEVSSGKLVQVLPGWHRKPLEKSVYIRSSDYEESGGRIAKFTAWLVEEERKQSFLREASVFNHFGESSHDYV
ncbi:MAG: hypothetical protein ACFWTZ_06790 [Burkholderia sp.]|jgi:DNA-binding transcriptional LysR family regulator